ncbi:hypothetical protein BDY24DRAFT_212038 [Mrakia frigida]|uniref:uncharacterized protein n=1 Tax=Mrakia frigida TaxID=29902 RepID=UPI003FCC050F
MFSSMSVASAPTSSLQQREVEGEELDAPVRSSLPFLLCLLSPTLTRALYLFRLQWLDLRKPSIDTHARLHEPINLEGLPSECNLFDVSSKKGVFVAAGIDAFSIYSLEALETLFTTAPRSTTSPLLPIKTVSLGERLVWIKFAKEDSVVITSTSSSTIRIFSVEALKSEQAPQPLQSFPSLPSAIISLQPNPEALPSLVLILQAASLSLLDVDSQTETMRLEGRYTAATWSPKGKQVVVGDEQGRLRFFGPDGSEKGVALARPSGLEGDYFGELVSFPSLLLIRS